MTSLVAEETSGEIFASNRARSRVKLSVKDMLGRTRRARVHESGSLRARFPGPRREELDAVLVNTGGGIAGGDRLEIELSIGERAQMMATTAAAEKVYRSLGADAVLNMKLDVAAGGSLAWLPQETIIFDGARFNRKIGVDLGQNASLLLVEALIFGRRGMAETVACGSVRDRWRVRRCGTLIYAENVAFDGEIAKKLVRPACANGGIALATALLIPCTDDTINAVHATSDRLQGEVGASTWNGIGLVRFCAPDGATLRHDLMQVLPIVRNGELPRLWTN